MTPIPPSQAELGAAQAYYHKKQDAELAKYDCTDVPEDDRFKGQDNKDEKEWPTIDPPKLYRGFLSFPNLYTQDGRAQFYKGFERGVSKEEDEDNVRIASVAFIDSLFVDYHEAFDERLHSIGNTLRGMHVMQLTENELDRLQRSPELFESAEAKASFQKRLVKQFREQESQLHEAAKANISKAKHNKREREALNPTYKPDMPDWSQFLSNGSPGMPTMTGMFRQRRPLISDQVLPPAAHGIVDNWKDECRRIMETERLTDQPGPSHEVKQPILTESRPMIVTPSPFRNHDQEAIDNWNDETSLPLTLPQVNRVIEQAFEIEREPVVNPRNTFEGTRVREYRPEELELFSSDEDGSS